MKKLKKEIRWFSIMEYEDITICKNLSPSWERKPFLYVHP